MAAPTATEIRNELEGYGITSSILSDAWIERCRDEEVIPHIEDITGMTFDGISTVTEYYNGNGKSTLILNRRPIVAVTSIEYTNQVTEGNLEEAIEVVVEEGILKGVSDYNEGIYAPLFKKGDKNIKVTYTYGTSDYQIKAFRAIKNLVAAKMLLNVGNRTGGGDLTVQAFSRSYGPNGKYTHKMKELIASGYSLLRQWMTGVVGG